MGSSSQAFLRAFLHGGGGDLSSHHPPERVPCLGVWCVAEVQAPRGGARGGAADGGLCAGGSMVSHCHIPEELPEAGAVVVPLQRGLDPGRCHLIDFTIGEDVSRRHVRGDVVVCTSESEGDEDACSGAIRSCGPGDVDFVFDEPWPCGRVGDDEDRAVRIHGHRLHLLSARRTASLPEASVHPGVPLILVASGGRGGARRGQPRVAAGPVPDVGPLAVWAELGEAHAHRPDAAAVCVVWRVAPRPDRRRPAYVSDRMGRCRKGARLDVAGRFLASPCHRPGRAWRGSRVEGCAVRAAYGDRAP